jgi:hypothetical protein
MIDKIQIIIINLFSIKNCLAYLAGENFVECIAVIPECNTSIGCDVINVDILVQIYYKFAFRMNLKCKVVTSVSVGAN